MPHLILRVSNLVLNYHAFSTTWQSTLTALSGDPRAVSSTSAPTKPAAPVVGSRKVGVSTRI